MVHVRVLVTEGGMTMAIGQSMRRLKSGIEEDAETLPELA